MREKIDERDPRAQLGFEARVQAHKQEGMAAEIEEVSFRPTSARPSTLDQIAAIFASHSSAGAAFLGGLCAGRWFWQSGKVDFPIAAKW